MSALLAQLVLTALAIAVPVTLAAFVGTPARPSLRIWARTCLVAAAVGVLGPGVGVLAGSDPVRSALVGAVLALAVLACGGVARPWTTRGLLAWSTALVAGAAFLAYLLAWIVSADLSLAAAAGSAAVWLVGVLVSVLGLGYFWQLVDAMSRWDRGRRRHREPTLFVWTRGVTGVPRWGVAPTLATLVAAGAVLFAAAPVSGPSLQDLPRMAGRESEGTRGTRSPVPLPTTASATPSAEAVVEEATVEPRRSSTTADAPAPAGQPTATPAATRTATPTAQPTATGTSQPLPRSAAQPTDQPTKQQKAHPARGPVAVPASVPALDVLGPLTGPAGHTR